MPSWPILTAERHRQLAVGWLFICLMLVAALFWLLPRSQINSSVLALLPKQQLQGLPDDLSRDFSQRLDRQLMWLVSPPAGQGSEAALDWLTTLRQLPA